MYINFLGFCFNNTLYVSGDVEDQENRSSLSDAHHKNLIPKEGNNNFYIVKWISFAQLRSY